MSEIKEMVIEVVEQILKDKIEKKTVDLLESGMWAEDLWQILLENELHNIMLSEELGGAGGDLEDLLTVYSLMGQYAAPIPFIEHTLSNYLLQQVKLPVQQTLTTYHISQPLQLENDHLQGKLQYVPWARYAKQLVTLAKDSQSNYIVLVDIAEGILEKGTNLAAEPRDHISLNGVKVRSKVAISKEEWSQFQKIVTAVSVSKMYGALKTAFELSIQFSKAREQFGRPIHRFQLVQQRLAIMAGEEALMKTATANMQMVLVKQVEQYEVAYARLRMDEAAKTVATSSHQVHAAIGVTHEHQLHQFTRRLWAWRDEEFTSRYWKEQLVQESLSSEVDLWTTLTRTNELIII